jgi:hypothetical protein
MSEKDKNKPNQPSKEHHPASEADPETLHTTDPQEHMKGPVSSFMQKTKKLAEDNDNQPKEAEKHEGKKNATGGDFINK